MGSALSPIFGILGTLVVIICLLAIVQPWGGENVVRNSFVMVICFFFAFVYMLLDTFAIVNGKYSKMVSKQDYIYGSSKLFLDFVLAFGLLANFME